MLLWGTHGGVVNAAVLGIVPRMRYILLTDGLIEQLPAEQVEAVMAHEVAHVRRHHMPWMVVIGLATLGICAAAVDGMAWLIEWAFMPSEYWWSHTAQFGVVVALGPWALVFGYISRRLERQADTFAVQHMSVTHPDPQAPPNTITEHAVNAMSSALQNVAVLNQVAPARPSWRHGSILWRIGYLQSLVGAPLNACSIDREIRRICAATVMLLGLGIALAILFNGSWLF